MPQRGFREIVARNLPCPTGSRDRQTGLLHPAMCGYFPEYGVHQRAKVPITAREILINQPVSASAALETLQVGRPEHSDFCRSSAGNWESICAVTTHPVCRKPPFFLPKAWLLEPRPEQLHECNGSRPQSSNSLSVGFNLTMPYDQRYMAQLLGKLNVGYHNRPPAFSQQTLSLTLTPSSKVSVISPETPWSSQACPGS